MRFIWTMLMLVAATAWCTQAEARAEPIGTTFTYQGQLKEEGAPANGEYDFVFRLFDASSGPAQVGSDVPVNDWPVSNGLFTVPIDFGSGVFTGDALWLEVAVRPGDSNGDHTILTPRQSVTAAPYALYALDGLGGVVEHWTADGVDIHNANAGKVGIRTADPLASLEVLNEGNGWAVLGSSIRGGVYGLQGATIGTAPGVHGETNSFEAEASGVRGVVHNTAAGPGSAGVRGINNSTWAGGAGVWGSQDGSGTGVYGTCPDGIGVFGKATGAEGENIAVKGRTFSDEGYAGYFQGGRNYFEGDVGIGTTEPDADLDVGGKVRIYGGSVGSMTMRGANGTTNTVIGSPGFTPNTGYYAAYDSEGSVRAQMYVNLQAEGYISADVKSFCVPHPDNPAEDIWYACVEGPEAAMYVRGTGRLVDGRATIELPDHFRALAAEDGMTVQLTPRSVESTGLATTVRSLDSIEVGELHGGRGNYEFDWEVKAVRRAHQDFNVTRSWTHAMPGGGPSKDELWAARLRSIDKRERRIQEMEARFAAKDESEGK